MYKYNHWWILFHQAVGNLCSSPGTEWTIVTVLIIECIEVLLSDFQGQVIKAVQFFPALFSLGTFPLESSHHFMKQNPCCVERPCMMFPRGSEASVKSQHRPPDTGCMGLYSLGQPQTSSQIADHAEQRWTILSALSEFLSHTNCEQQKWWPFWATEF